MNECKYNDNRSILQEFKNNAVTEKEAAALLDVGQRTLQRWRHIGYGPKWIKRGGRIVYRTDWLAEWQRRIEMDR